MNEQLTGTGFWETQIQQAVWLDWLQPFVYILLAIAVAGLLMTMFDLALMFLKELQAESTKPALRNHTPASPVSRRGTESLAEAFLSSFSDV